MATGFDSWGFAPFDEKCPAGKILNNSGFQKLSEYLIDHDLSIDFQNAEFGKAIATDTLDSKKVRDLIAATDQMKDLPEDLKEKRVKIFVPSIAGIAQGAALPNLTSLGLMSDRILNSFVLNTKKSFYEEQSPLLVVKGKAQQSTQIKYPLKLDTLRYITRKTTDEFLSEQGFHDLAWDVIAAHAGSRDHPLDRHWDSEAVTRCKALKVPLRATGSLIPALAVV